MRTKISEFSATPGDNTDIDGIDIAEGCAPSGINNAIRELMAQLKDMQTGASGDNFTFTTVDVNGGTIDGTAIGSSSASTGAFTNLSYTGTFTGGTGVVNLGSGQFYKDSSGNIGIGTSSPTVKLTVGTYANAGTSGTAGIYGSNIAATNTAGILTVGATDALAADIGGSIGFTANAGTLSGYPTGAIAGRRENATSGNDASYMQFTTSTSAGTVAERMRIDSSGNMGIGTSSPTALVHASGAGTGFKHTNGSVTLAQYSDSVNGVSEVNGPFIIRTTNANPLVFQTNNADSMRIDSSGNVGIGTSAPGQKLHLYGSGSTYSYVQSTNAGSGAGAYYENATRKWLIGAGPQSGGSEFQIYDSTASAERMRIDSSGNLMVGTTTLGQANTTGYAFNSQYLSVGHANGTAGGTLYESFSYNGTAIGYISQNGTTAVTYSTTSDYRLKENVAPMTGALEKVAALKPVTYTWKSDGSYGQGFIAHELQAVVPECVTGEKDAVETVDELDADGNKIGTKEVPRYQGIDTSFLVATLTAAIQELKAELDATKAEIAALKGN